ncbi:hypothetical protein ABZS29_38235 [Kribbella sp. NPDC005582]|uniref:hypothetical protein n=1 Tax=Kribbella sp. NPDC005582 TaxID=3156893 RepID=UPI0033A3E008
MSDSLPPRPVYGQPGPYVAPPSMNPFGAPPEPEPVMPWAKAILVTVVVFLVAGVVGGWAWQQFSPLAQYTVDEQGGSLGEEQMTRVFGPDGTFTAIGFVAALLLGGALFWWLRNYGPWSVAIVVLGACLGSGVAWGVGMLLGHDSLNDRLQAAKPGDLVAAPLELHTWTPIAAWLVGAALAAAVISATTWRSEPDATGSKPVASEGHPPVH